MRTQGQRTPPKLKPGCLAGYLALGTLIVLGRARVGLEVRSWTSLPSHNLKGEDGHAI